MDSKRKETSLDATIRTRLTLRERAFEPVSKLLELTREIERVGRADSVVVPGIATRLELHTMVWRWPLKPRGRKRAVPALNYFSDEAWLPFDGFRSASIQTFAYLPVLIKNTLIFKRRQLPGQACQPLAGFFLGVDAPHRGQRRQQALAIP